MSMMKGFGVIEPTVSVGWMEKEIPEPGPFEALCSPVAVLPCTSDVHNARTRKAYPNRILGHEGIGRIEKVGEYVTDFKPGDLVAICGVTPVWRGVDIQEGNYEHVGGFLGSRYLSSKIDGLFGEYFIIPDADMNLAKVPEGVSLEAAALVGDMVCTGFTGAVGANIQFGETVVVLGIGPVGLMAVAATALRGAGRIIAIGHREKCKELAKIYGATDIIDYKDGPVSKQVLELTGGKRVDKIILAGGNEDNLSESYKMIKCGGTISNLCGYKFDKSISFSVADAGSLVNNVTLIGRLQMGGRLRLERLMAIIEAGRLDPTHLISHRFHGFDKIEEAFDLMANKTEDVIKPIVFI